MVGIVTFIKALTLAGSVLALAAPASAAERFVIQGDELFDACVTGVEAKDDARHSICTGYVWGVADMDLDFKNCTAQRQIHGKQMREVVTNYVKAHPEHRDLPGAVQVRLALFAAFCPSTKLTISGVVE